jgi:GDSL-like Lipase/Acylhydrolase family/PEP-CTERM motif
MAVMGDSISAGSGVSGGSPNWVAQLNSTFPGAITFHNDAVGGATSSTVVSGQLPAVVTLAENHQIADSVLMIGGNDAASTAGLEIAEGGSPTSFINTYVSNVEDVINSMATAGPTVAQVFANMPDVTVTPEVQQVAASAGISADGLQLLSAAIGQANAQADAYALSRNVPVVDLYTASQVITAAIPITLAGHSFTTAFAPDNFHPAPFLQGLLGNMVDMAFNQAFGQTLPLLSDQQIVHNVGFTPAGSTSFYNVQPFVLVPLPGDATGDGIVNGQDLSLMASHWLSTGTNVSGDANHDGIVNGQDMALAASNWLQAAAWYSGASGSAANVPEPSTLVLAALAGLALLGYRCGRAQRSRV